jgi:hypothetical protein
MFSIASVIIIVNKESSDYFTKVKLKRQAHYINDILKLTNNAKGGKQCLRGS